MHACDPCMVYFSYCMGGVVANATHDNTQTATCGATLLTGDIYKRTYGW